MINLKKMTVFLTIALFLNISSAFAHEASSFKNETFTKLRDHLWHAGLTLESPDSSDPKGITAIQIPEELLQALQNIDV